MPEGDFVPDWMCTHCGASEYQPLHRGDCPNATREDSLNAVLDDVLDEADGAVFEGAFDTAMGKAREALDFALDEIDGAEEDEGKVIESLRYEAAQRAGRYFETGAYRDTDVGKNDYEGYLSPAVIRRFGDYMTKHRVQSDGTVRESDNWQKGIPQNQYMKSMWRHFLDVWTLHRNGGDPQEALCALLFNVMGYLHEELKK